MRTRDSHGGPWLLSASALAAVFCLSCVGAPWGGPPAFSAEASRAYYVAPNGSDNSSGTIAQPFKTLKRALPSLKPGDTLLVRAGEYDTAAGLGAGLANNGASIIPSGVSWERAVTIKAYPGEKPVFRRYLPPGFAYSEEEVRNAVHLPTYDECAKFASYGLVKNYPQSCWQGSGNNQPADGLFWQAPKGFVAGYVVDMVNIRSPVKYVVIDGIDLDAKGIVPNPIGFSDFSEHIRLQNLEIRYGIGSCVTQLTSNELTHKNFDLQFINTKIHSCGVPFDTNKVGNVLARKHIAARYWHGWYLHAGGASFIDSESYNNAGTGLGPDGDNIIVRNSYIHDNTAQGIYITGGDNWVIENSVFYNNGLYEIYNFGGIGHRVRHNTVVAGPRNDYSTTGNISAGLFLHAGSGGSVFENNIIDGFRYGVINQSQLPRPNTLRDNLIRSNPSGSEILTQDGATRLQASGNILNQDPLFIDRKNADFRLQPKSPAFGKAPGQNLGAK